MHRPTDRTPPPAQSPSRRRALAILLGAAGAAWWPGQGRAMTPLHRWEGVALGAPARITLAHGDIGAAADAVALCRAEIDRLEDIFSLHRPESELSRLNRDGALAAPSHDLVRLLGESRHYSRLSGGAFDATVQPLWALYARHFSDHPGSSAGPPAAAIAAARRLVDYRRVSVAAERIGLARPGMAVTLNGIAQGYVTDRVAALLRDLGASHALAEVGEIAAIGGHPAGRPWRVARTLYAGQRRGPAAIELADLAVATSAGHGTRFDRAGRHHHLFDPASGASAATVAAVTVLAASATAADALSTALFVAPPARWQGLLRAGGGRRAIIERRDGGTLEIGVT
jgi:FAD:protein FMN transferase